jgi:Tfp pilus assembly PilM family ATPase
LRTYLTGPFFSQAEIAEGVIALLPNAEILYPFRKIKCNAGMDEQTLREFAPLLAVSVGLALRDVE